MARIPLTSGFTVIPEGNYTFKVTSVSYDETWGKLEIKLITEQNQTHTERFTLKDANTDEPNERALNAFSFFAKTVMDDFNKADIDPNELVGHYLNADVEHTVVPSRTNPNKNLTFCKLTNMKPAPCFESELGEDVEATPDLDALLD